jgi:hypothetical protein
MTVPPLSLPVFAADPVRAAPLVADCAGPTPAPGCRSAGGFPAFHGRAGGPRLHRFRSYFAFRRCSFRRVVPGLTGLPAFQPPMVSAAISRAGWSVLRRFPSWMQCEPAGAPHFGQRVDALTSSLVNVASDR